MQLWAESLGKKKGYKRYGLTPVGLIGSRDQHSFLQLIMDGVKDKTVSFIKVALADADTAVPNLSLNGLEGCDFVNGLSLGELINAQCGATTHALVQEGISTDVIELERLEKKPQTRKFTNYRRDLAASRVNIERNQRTLADISALTGDKFA